MSKLTKKLINFTIQETNIIFFNKEIKNYQQAISINKLLWIQKILRIIKKVIILQKYDKKSHKILLSLKIET